MTLFYIFFIFLYGQLQFKCNIQITYNLINYYTNKWKRILRDLEDINLAFRVCLSLIIWVLESVKIVIDIPSRELANGFGSSVTMEIKYIIIINTRAYTLVLDFFIYKMTEHIEQLQLNRKVENNFLLISRFIYCF